MKYTANDFIKIRSKIIQNSILNSLLIAYLSASKGPVFVGKTLIKLDGKLKEVVKESTEYKNGKISNFVMVDIFANINNVPATLGYIYKDYPPVFLGREIFANKNMIKDTVKKSIVYYLKLVANAIYNIYSINASSADKIFSTPPKSFSVFLANNGISLSYWKIGLSKRVKEKSLEDVEESELEEYYEALNNRLLLWRNFNLLLIELIKKGRTKISNNEYGEVKAEVFFRSLNDICVALEIIPKGKLSGDIHMLDCEKLSPKTLNLKDNEKFYLLKIFRKK